MLNECGENRDRGTYLVCPAAKQGTPRYVPSTPHSIPRKMAYLTNAFFLFQQGIEGTPPDVPASRRDMQETSPYPIQARWITLLLIPVKRAI